MQGPRPANAGAQSDLLLLLLLHDDDGTSWIKRQEAMLEMGCWCAGALDDSLKSPSEECVVVGMCGRWPELRPPLECLIGHSAVFCVHNVEVDD